MAKSIYAPINVSEVSIFSDDTQQQKLLHTTIESALQESEVAFSAADRMQGKAKPKSLRSYDICIPEGCDSLEIVVTDLINQTLGTNKPYIVQVILT